MTTCKSCGRRQEETSDYKIVKEGTICDGLWWKCVCTSSHFLKDTLKDEWPVLKKSKPEVAHVA